MNLAFKGKYIITSQIVCESGLHIGGATEGVEIGGIDNPVIKDPLTDKPYLPGSSLKGKLRHLLEWHQGVIKEQHPKHGGYTAHWCGDCHPCIIFGPASDDTKVRLKAGPTRVTIRDAYPCPDSIKEWEAWLGEKVYTEVKWENTIDRVTSEANPRPMERVPKGSKFKVEMIFDIYDEEKDRKLLKSLFTAMCLLEDSSLGGSGSRGHGRVKFENTSVEWRPIEFYKNGNGQKTIDLRNSESIKHLIENFNKINWEGNG